MLVTEHRSREYDSSIPCRNVDRAGMRHCASQSRAYSLNEYLIIDPVRLEQPPRTRSETLCSVRKIASGNAAAVGRCSQLADQLVTKYRAATPSADGVQEVEECSRSSCGIDACLDCCNVHVLLLAKRITCFAAISGATERSELAFSSNCSICGQFHRVLRDSTPLERMRAPRVRCRRVYPTQGQNADYERRAPLLPASNWNFDSVRPLP
jgi:hypothetical protein